MLVLAAGFGGNDSVDEGPFGYDAAQPPRLRSLVVISGGSSPVSEFVEAAPAEIRAQLGIDGPRVPGAKSGP